MLFQYPRIDTQELDRQIKGIMTEVIPVLKEHMDDMCSQQLLQYIKRLVLSLTKQKDDSQEFVRFFHKQLGSILSDSLAKFEGRKWVPHTVNNNNNDNLFLTRVTQSSTGLDFCCGPLSLQSLHWKDNPDAVNFFLNCMLAKTLHPFALDRISLSMEGLRY